MVKFLIVIGISVIIIAIILGFASGSFMGFVAAAGSGIASATIFFALAMILENQELILYHLQKLPKPSKGKSTCSRCGKQYDEDMNSCPHCGYRA